MNFFSKILDLFFYLLGLAIFFSRFQIQRQILIYSSTFVRSESILYHYKNISVIHIYKK